MVIITNPGITEEQLDHIREYVEARGMRTMKYSAAMKVQMSNR